MEDFSDHLKSSFDFKNRRREKEKAISKEKLFSVSKKKIQTTMIGAIATIEANFGFLWTGDNLTNEQLELKSIFEEVRSEILDRGNNQIRNLENEFNHYEVFWKRYTLNLPFIGRDKNV